MVKRLKEKKMYVIHRLIESLSHTNRELEPSLNAHDVLIELVETEKTLDIFLDNEGLLINKLLDLAIDPSNSHN